MLKDVVVAIAAIVGSVVAIKGLNTWQRQLKGQSEYELSRRILVTLFKYRDAIDGVRYPVLWAQEQSSPPEDEAKKMNSDQLRFYGLSKAYQVRWDKVNVEKNVLYPDLLEAEVMWGDELKNLFQAVFNLEHELLAALRNNIKLMDPDTRQSQKDAISMIYKNKRDVLYEDFEDE